MMEVNGLPAENRREGPKIGHIVTKRSGHRITDDGRFPGDVIEWPGALDNPGYLEHLSNFAEDIDPQPLIVSVLDPDDHVHPCAFCSGEASYIAERGIVDSDYVLQTLDGQLVGYTCFTCIEEAPVVDREE